MGDMATVSPIPPAGSPRTPASARATEPARAAAGPSFRAHLKGAASKAKAGLASGSHSSTAAAVRPATSVRHPPSDASTADVEARAKGGAAGTDRDASDEGRSTPSLGIDPLDPMARALFAEGPPRLAFDRGASSVPATSAAPPLDTAAQA